MDESLFTQLTKMIDGLTDLKRDAEAADKGNKAAGTRVRVALSATKKTCDGLRKKALDLRK